MHRSLSCEIFVRVPSFASYLRKERKFSLFRHKLGLILWRDLYIWISVLKSGRAFRHVYNWKCDRIYNYQSGTFACSTTLLVQWYRDLFILKAASWKRGCPSSRKKFFFSRAFKFFLIRESPYVPKPLNCLARRLPVVAWFKNASFPVK